MASKDLLSEYINKILSLQEQQSEFGMTESALKQVATELGMDDADWKKVQEYAQHYKSQGEGFVRYHNWGKAIEAFHQALPIIPYDEGLLQKLSECYYMRWTDDANYADRRMAVEFAERCLKQNPQNDTSLKIITKLPSPKTPLKRPRYASHPAAKAPSGSPGKKVALLAGLGAAVLGAILTILFSLFDAGGGPQSLEVIQTPVRQQLGPGQRNIPITFIGNPGVGSVSLSLQEAVFQEYAKSSSFMLKGYIRGVGAEIERLKLRLALLDKNGKQLFRIPIDVIKQFDDPARSKELIPLSFFEHIRKKGIYPHSAELSISRINWRNIPSPYQAGIEKKTLNVGSAKGTELLFLESGSAFNEHPKDRYVFHKLFLEIRNPEGADAIKSAEGKIRWVDANNNRLLEEKFTFIEEDDPQLLPGQSILFKVGEKIRKAENIEDIARYQIYLEEIVYAN